MEAEKSLVCTVCELLKNNNAKLPEGQSSRPSSASVFSLPKSFLYRQLWLQIIQELVPKKIKLNPNNVIVCGAHFPATGYKVILDEYELTSDAVPEIKCFKDFSFHNHPECTFCELLGEAPEDEVPQTTNSNLFKLPKNAETRDLWMEKVTKKFPKLKIPVNHFKVCPIHFAPSSFENVSKRYELNKDAVPEMKWFAHELAIAKENEEKESSPPKKRQAKSENDQEKIKDSPKVTSKLSPDKVKPSSKVKVTPDKKVETRRTKSTPDKKPDDSLKAMSSANKTRVSPEKTATSSEDTEQESADENQLTEKQKTASTKKKAASTSSEDMEQESTEENSSDEKLTEAQVKNLAKLRVQVNSLTTKNKSTRQAAAKASFAEKAQTRLETKAKPCPKSKKGDKLKSTAAAEDLKEINFKKEPKSEKVKVKKEKESDDNYDSDFEAKPSSKVLKRKTKRDATRTRRLKRTEIHCDQCKFVTDSPIKYRVHKARFHNEKPVDVQCQICNAKFKHELLLDRHMMKHAGGRIPEQPKWLKKETQLACMACDVSFSCRNDYLQHHENHRDFYKCPICNKELHSFKQSRAHIYKCRQPKIKCDQCDFECKNRHGLLSHKQTHSRTTYYPCDICQKVFTTKSQCRIHQNVHTGVKPYDCGICQLAFADPSTRRKHLMSHTKVKKTIEGGTQKGRKARVFKREPEKVEFITDDDVEFATLDCKSEEEWVVEWLEEP